MDMDFIEKPSLTEPGVKYFINTTLKNCRDFKNKYYNILLNVGLIGLFILLVCFVLLVKYKGKLTPHEKELKNREKQQYILSKIKNYQNAKLNAQQQLITGLPHFTNDF